MNEAEQRLRALASRMEHFTNKLRENPPSKEEIQGINTKLEQLDFALDKLAELQVREANENRN